MGKTKEHPCYNVKSCRISDDLNVELRMALRGRTINRFLVAAIEEKIHREQRLPRGSERPQ